MRFESVSVKVVRRVLLVSLILFINGSVNSDVKSTIPPSNLNGFIHSYFSSWSDGNDVLYSNHFHQSAAIYFKDKNGLIHGRALPKFLEQQRRIITSENNLIEYPTKVEIYEYEESSSVVVNWVLEDGQSTRTGIDIFTLVKTPTEKWKIISLLFYFT